MLAPGPAVALTYALACLLAVPSVFSQAELATAMPRSGGTYFVVERSLGTLAGTIVGLLSWLSISVKACFALVGVGTLVMLAWPRGGSWAMRLTATTTRTATARWSSSGGEDAEDCREGLDAAGA